LKENKILGKIIIDSSNLRKGYFINLKKHFDFFENNFDIIARVNYKD